MGVLHARHFAQQQGWADGEDAEERGGAQNGRHADEAGDDDADGGGIDGEGDVEEDLGEEPGGKDASGDGDHGGKDGEEEELDQRADQNFAPRRAQHLVEDGIGFALAATGGEAADEDEEAIDDGDAAHRRDGEGKLAQGLGDAGQGGADFDKFYVDEFAGKEAFDVFFATGFGGDGGEDGGGVSVQHAGGEGDEEVDAALPGIVAEIADRGGVRLAKDFKANLIAEFYAQARNIKYFLGKPYNKDMLGRAIRDVLDKDA